jgi:hypothetical protein
MPSLNWPLKAALLASTSIGAAAPALANIVNVAAGASIEAAIQANPAGTTFQLAADTYTGQQFAPLSGDTIMGDPGGGTILNGGGMTSSMTTGTPASNVTIGNLTTTNYQTATQTAPIMTGSRWQILNVTSTGNGGAGLYIGGTNNVVQGGSYSNNGQIGIDGSAANGSTITGVTVTGNNTTNVNQQWDAGGIKITNTNGLTIANSTVSNNNGNGIWADINSSNWTIKHNTVNGNAANGIMYEISHAATITGNAIAGNTGSGVYISNSDGVTASGNAVSVSASNTLQGDGTGGGIVSWSNSGRGVDPSGIPYQAVNNTITGNTIAEASSANSAILAAAGQPTSGDVFSGNTVVPARTAIAATSSPLAAATTAVKSAPAALAAATQTPPSTYPATSASPAPASQPIASTTSEPPATPATSATLAPASSSAGTTALGTYVGTFDNTNSGAQAAVDQQYHQFAGAMGQSPKLINTYIGNSTPESQWVQTAQWAANSLKADPLTANATPVIGLPMASTGETADQSFKNIINGSEDAIFKGIFQAWVNAGYTGLYIRPGFEMNGTWDPWSVTAADAADYIAAFQHIAALAHAFSGALIDVVWNSNVGSTPVPYAQLYPGNTAVDIIGLDTYGAPVNTDSSPTDNSTSPTDFTLLDALALAKANGKEFALPETGGTDAAFPPALASTIAASGVQVAFVNIWDSSGDYGNLAWSDDPTVSAAWAAAFKKIAGNGATIAKPGGNGPGTVSGNSNAVTTATSAVEQAAANTVSSAANAVSSAASAFTDVLGNIVPVATAATTTVSDSGSTVGASRQGGTYNQSSIADVAHLVTRAPTAPVGPVILASAAPTGTSSTPAAVQGGTTVNASTPNSVSVAPTGNNTINVTTSGSVVNATGGAETVNVSAPGNSITTGPYDDTVTLNSQGNTINTGGGNNTVILDYGDLPDAATGTTTTAVGPLESIGNVFNAPAPGTGTMTIQGTLASNDFIDLTQALAGTTWNHQASDIANYVTASGNTISVGGKAIVKLISASDGQLANYITAH